MRIILHQAFFTSPQLLPSPTNHASLSNWGALSLLNPPSPLSAVYACSGISMGRPPSPSSLKETDWALPRPPSAFIFPFLGSPSLLSFALSEAGTALSTECGSKGLQSYFCLMWIDDFELLKWLAFQIHHGFPSLVPVNGKEPIDPSSNSSIQNALCQPPGLGHLRSSSGSPHRKAPQGH